MPLHTRLNHFLNRPTQIASYLSPLELLRCARASKMLRSTLLSSKNRRMWRSALDAVPQLPACPDDMSEPAYAALLFDDCCLVRDVMFPPAGCVRPAD